MGTTKKVVITIIGGLLLVVGLAYLLEIFGVGFRSWALLAMGLVLLCTYFNTKKKVCLFLSYPCITLGLAVLICTVFVPYVYLPFTFVMAVALSLLLVYFNTKKSLFLYIALGVSYIDICNLLSIQMMSAEKLNGYLFLIAGIVMIILFMFENKKLGYSPLVLSLLAYLAGFTNLAYSYNMISIRIFKAIIAGLFIITGVVLVCYVVISSKNKDKEN